MNPQATKTTADFLLTDFEGKIALTTGVFAAFSSDRCDYHPDEKSKTTLGLLRHITLKMSGCSPR